MMGRHYTLQFFPPLPVSTGSRDTGMLQLHGGIQYVGPFVLLQFYFIFRVRGSNKIDHACQDSGMGKKTDVGCTAHGQD